MEKARPYGPRKEDLPVKIVISREVPRVPGDNAVILIDQLKEIYIDGRLETNTSNRRYNNL